MCQCVAVTSTLMRQCKWLPAYLIASQMQILQRSFQRSSADSQVQLWSPAIPKDRESATRWQLQDSQMDSVLVQGSSRTTAPCCYLKPETDTWVSS